MVTADPPVPAADFHRNPPAACGVAFKEWLGVCRALGSGRQSLILRKGGVAEIGGEFRPEHPAFWLYPTLVHQAEQGLRTPDFTRSPDQPAPFDPQAVVPIRTLAVVEWTGRVETLDQLARLEPWHDWTDATVRGRFDYRRPGLWAMVVRVFERLEPVLLGVTPEQVGCRTWVPLAAAISTADSRLVVPEAVLRERLVTVREVLAPACST